jgi:hypothetical protein
MSIHKLDINCRNEACEHEFTFDAEYDPGERATWGYSGGSPEVPASFYPVDEQVLCPKCGHDNTPHAEQACFDYDPEDDRDEDDRRDWDNIDY